MNENNIKIKAQVLDKLNEMVGPDGGFVKLKRTDNKGPHLWPIYFWQEVSKYSEKQLKAAWTRTQDAQLVPNDDELRTLSGEQILQESEQFSVVVDVGAPRETFSKDQFVEAVAKKYKLDPAKLNAIAATCISKSKAPLSKKVLEA